MKKSLHFDESDMSLEFCLARGTNARYMDKSVYDADGDGVVDNATRLGGYLPSHFATADSVSGVVPHIDEVSGNWFLGEVDTGVCARGANGKDGANGIDGKDGTNGATPTIDSATGHWLIDGTDTGVCARGENGVDGKDGKDGANGKDGADGVTPLFFVDEGELVVSYDTGENWTSIGYVQGADGRDGYNGHDGTDGRDGEDGEDAFEFCELPIAEWDEESNENFSYHLKLFSYPDSVLADVELRLAVNAIIDVDGAPHQGQFGYRYAFNLARPFYDTVTGVTSSRITLKPLRVMFEDEAHKDVVEYLRAYEKQSDEGWRELWLEIKTTGHVAHAAMSVHKKFGDLMDLRIQQKAYDPFVAKTGFDSLTVYSADWANKTSNFNLSSRATATYASASGNDSRAEGVASDVGGIENTGKGEADFVRGKKNTNTGAASLVTGTNSANTGATSLVVGANNSNTAPSSLVAGSGNTNKGSTSSVLGSSNSNSSAHSLLSGTKNTNTGSNAIIVGHTNTNVGEHVFIHGYENHNDATGSARCDYVDMHGTRLEASRRLQTLRGQWNAKDARAIAIFANGTSESNRKNVFTIAADGTPSVATDGVTVAHLTHTQKDERKALDQRYTNALKGAYASAEHALLLTDVSPVEHNVLITTWQDSTLAVTGKNLFDSDGENISDQVDVYGLSHNNDETYNVVTLVCKSDDTNQSARIVIPEGERLVGSTVTLSGKWTPFDAATGHMKLSWAKADGTQYVPICEVANSGETATGVVSEKPHDEAKLCLILYANHGGSAKVDDIMLYEEVQLELGSEASAYERNKPWQLFTLAQKVPNTYGDYIARSVSPNMSVFGNGASRVTVKDYNKDINTLTPRRGVDYFTEQDLNEIVARVVAQLSS